MRWIPSCLLMAALVASVARVSAGPSPFVVAIVRDDGIVLPVAAFNDGRWRMPWPGPAREAEVPVRLEDCPLAWWGLPSRPTHWTLHTRDSAPRLIDVDRVTWVLSHCYQQVALHSRTAVREVLRAADGWRAPKQGVAIAGDATVTLPRHVDVTSAEARALLDHVQRAFNYEERMMLARDYFAVYLPSIDADERDRMPVQALSIYRGPGRASDDVYFVELQRRYPRRSPESLRWCDEVTFMSGWAHPGRGGVIELSLISNDVTSCLLDRMVRTVPHAILDTDRGPVWLLEEYRREAEAFALYLAPDRDRAVEIGRRFAGSCNSRDRPMPLPPRPIAPAAERVP